MIHHISSETEEGEKGLSSSVCILNFFFLSVLNFVQEWCRKGCFSITFIFCPMPDPPAVSDNFEGILNVPIIFVKLELMG